MATQERNYTIPLRKSYTKVPKYYRTKRAVNDIKKFISKHMKVEEKNIKLGNNLNMHLWEHGIKNPPGKVKVKIIKDQEKATVELEGFEYKVEKAQTKKTEQPKGLAGKMASLAKQKEDIKEKEKTEKEDKLAEKVEKEAEKEEKALETKQPKKENKPKKKDK